MKTFVCTLFFKTVRTSLSNLVVKIEVKLSFTIERTSLIYGFF